MEMKSAPTLPGRMGIGRQFTGRYHRLGLGQYIFWLFYAKSSSLLRVSPFSVFSVRYNAVARPSVCL